MYVYVCIYMYVYVRNYFTRGWKKDSNFLNHNIIHSNSVYLLLPPFTLTLYVNYIKR